MTSTRERNAKTDRASSAVDSVNRLVDAVTGLLGSVSHAAAGAALQLQASGARGVAKAPRVVARKSEKLRKGVAASWARYTPAQRAARIRKMLAGRGLKPRSAAKAVRRGRRPAKGADARTEGESRGD